MKRDGTPAKQGLYDPQYEHDACGIGVVANVKGKKSHDVVKQGLSVLNNLTHRGSCGCEANTGDGAGILFQIPHKFFKQISVQAGLTLPEAGQYGVGMVFLPKQDTLRRSFKKRVEEIIREEGQSLLGWRAVPTNNAALGKSAIQA